MLFAGIICIRFVCTFKRVIVPKFQIKVIINFIIFDNIFNPQMGAISKSFVLVACQFNL